MTAKLYTIDDGLPAIWWVKLRTFAGISNGSVFTILAEFGGSYQIRCTNGQYISHIDFETEDDMAAFLLKWA